MNGWTEKEIADYARSLDNDCLKYGIIDLKNQIKNNDRVVQSTIVLKVYIDEMKRRK
jgi:hypothetical protein